VYKLEVTTRSWELREPFVISRGTKNATETVIVTLVDSTGHVGRGESAAVYYAGETLESLIEQVESVQDQVEAGISREQLLNILPGGGARCAIDAALWDLEAKQSGSSVWEMAGVEKSKSTLTAYSIGMRSIAEYEERAREFSKYPILKVKVDRSNPIEAMQAVRRGAPDSHFIVDANQAWSVENLKAWAEPLAALNVVLLEQPIKVGDEPLLDGYRSPIKICADELVDDHNDLEKANGRFAVINIKLEKSGGLTQALRLAESARNMGFRLMVGCMGGSSLAMAPGFVLAQQCDFVDLDGPLLQSEDWPGGFRYLNGEIAATDPTFWGGI
jgi:L-alanine-DL-glutamate epimerase-like enolase superfamily enzyme